jgi:putative sterol carrier protein
LPTARNLVEALPALLRPEVAGRTRATVQLNLTGDGGGQWWVRIDGGACSVGAGRADKVDATLTAAATDYVQIRLGRLDALTATMDGRLRVEGKYGLAVKFAKMFRTVN